MLLVLLCIAAKGTFLIENPENSMINKHHRFRWLARRLRKCGGAAPWFTSWLCTLAN